MGNNKKDPPVMYHEKVKLPLFHVQYDVFMSWDLDHVTQHVREIYPGVDLEEHLHGGTFGYTMAIETPNGINPGIIIRLYDPEDAPADFALALDPHGTMVHEALHLTWYIGEALGLKFNYDSHETQAYMLEEVVRELQRVYAYALEKLSKPTNQ